MDRKKLQRQAASSVDELLGISEDISKYIIPAYGTAPKETFDMQCRFQLERCRRLAGKMERLKAELEMADNSRQEGSGTDMFHCEASGAGKAVPLTEEQRRSLAVTAAILNQNQVILRQKQELLEDFLAHSNRIQAATEEAREMGTQAEILRLKNTLRKELRQCQTENEE